MTEIQWLILTIAAMVIIFGLAWLFGKLINNYSIVDAVWAASIGSIGVTWLSFGTNTFSIRAVAIAILAFWSIRLTRLLAARIYRNHPIEDSRYVELRQSWQPNSAAIFFGFYQLQAISTILLALPFYFVAFDANQNWSTFETSGLIVAVIGIIGESTADSQMAAFKNSHQDPKSICRVGLWKYSRHPNYFFESVIWFGFYLFACGSTWGWSTVYAPLIMTFLLLKVTGIPPAEKSSLARKGNAFRRYQETTSAFIPLPPKKP
ncbi:DUF1295 domain-containing protein [Luteolibacter pohnpeiensis]|uniref:DUF1295 domain-containing protein n=1 Tax=Luteolibacter pohnpeiensis TaxID=454153 RepID=A0A934SA23_9BACT|nr:DUF1295 domain-containing protein [Luteolibacter pohnpeiensis]MBK1882417.1 DUF1295 domain-containing protein [Luteolibacter pohnpeiensis]